MSTPIRFKHKMVQFVWIPLLACTLALLYGMQPAYQGSTLGVVLNCAFLLLPVAVFIGYFSVLAYKWYSELGVSGRGIAVSGFVIALLAIAGCVMMGEFFQQERDIKIFDFATFWMATVEMRSVVETKPIHDVVALFLLRLSHEYTMVPAVPLALASYVFGQGYTGFCQSIYVLYYIPACVFVTLLAMRLAAIAGKSAGNRVLAFSVCLLLCVSNAPVAWPLMNGYVDIVGVLLLAIMMNLTLHWDGVTFSWRMVAALAILSLTTVLARRFFAFAVIGFFASFGIALLIDMVVSQRYSIARLGRLVVNMALIAAGASVLLFLLNRTIFQVFLGVNYSQAYSGAFSYLTARQNLALIMSQSGYLWFVLSCLGAYMLFSVYATRILCFRIMLIPIIGFILFRRVQDMNRHHAYIILLATTLFLSVLALFVINFIATRRHVAIKTLSAAMAVAFFVAFLGNIPLAFDSRYAELAEKTQPITTTLRRYPTVLSSYDAIQDITANFKERIQDSPERVYVATVSPLFNADYILRSEMPKRISAVDFLLKTNNVDLRDGFPSQAFTANYIALEYPFYQEFGNRQEVVYQLFDMVVNSRIGEEYYQLEQNYPIGDGKEVRLYRRTKNATIRLVDELKERLKTYYPETPLVFSPSYFIALAQILAPGNFSLHTNPGDNQIYFYKAANAEAAVRINDTSDFSRLAFQVRMVESHCDMVVRNQDGELFQQTVSAEGMIDVEVDIAGSEYLDLVFTDTDSNQPIGVFIMIFQPELR